MPHSEPAPADRLTATTVTDALRAVHYPGLRRDVVSFGIVDHVSVCDGRVKVRLALRAHDPTAPERLRADIERALRPLAPVSLAVEIAPPAASALPPLARTVGDPWGDQVTLASVRHVIAVGAGKGGVGKSTVAVNVALALAAGGLRVGILDADIYGPSVPMLLGIEDGASRARMSPEKHIIPLEAHGLSVISFGFFLGEGSPAVWRGPMVSKAVKQFARGVAWPELDVLVVDLPPGTGDVPLSLAQSVALSGAVVVTQPPRLAMAEARKAVAMFASLDAPVLGLVENMTGPFGSGAGRRLADELRVPLLGDVAFDEALVRDGDSGVPTFVAHPASDAAEAFERIARAIAGALGWAHVDADATPAAIGSVGSHSRATV